MIPTYRGLNTLPKALDGLRRQTLPPGEFEVVCVVDGPGGGEAAWLRRRRTPFSLRVLEQTHAGAGAARNRGASAASASLLGFMDDDIVPDAYFLASHLEIHAGTRQDRAAVGITTWHPAIRLTPLMRSIAPAGKLNAYHRVEDPSNLPFALCYGSNLSMPAALALRFPFNPALRCWEDTELGYRLAYAGVRLVLAPRAVGWHWRGYTRPAWERRGRQARRWRGVFLKLHPEVPRRPDRYLRAALAMHLERGA